MRDEATGSDSAVERGEEGGERGEVTEDEHKRRNEHGSRKTLNQDSGACGQSQEREHFFASTGTGRGTGKRNQTRRPAADGLGHRVLPISNTPSVT